MKRIAKSALIFMLTAVFAFSAASCGKTSNDSKPYISDTKFLLDTTCTISLYDKQDKNVLNQAFQLVAHYDKFFSMTTKGGDIYNINHAKGKPVKVEQDTIDVIKKGIEYSEKSGGIFDITIGALSSLWNFDATNPIVPPEDKIKAAVKTIGYKNIIISGDTVTLKNPDTMIDLGAIAKGFIADKVQEFLASKGVHRAIINLGGNVVVIGSKVKNTPWVVGVQQPFMDRNEDIGYLYVSDKSVVTSGIYERYFTQNGKLYMHILNPATGFPADNNLSSVTIISDESADGDGLSTTCFLLGVEKAEKFIETLKDVEAIFITKDGKVITTPGINNKIKFVPVLKTGSAVS